MVPLPMIVTEESIQAPLPNEAVESDRPMVVPPAPQLADPPASASPRDQLPDVPEPSPTEPPPVEPPPVEPPVSPPQDSQPPAPPLPAVSPPASSEPTPASPKDSDSSRLDFWKAIPKRSPVRAIHEQTEQPAGESLATVRMTEQARYHDPIRPSANPQPVADEPSRREELPAGLKGYCAVQLLEKESWVVGDSRWAVEHRGQVYLMSGADQQQRFLAAPDRYAPALSGNDPVLAVDESRQEPGQTDYCVVYDGRLYSFTNASTLARFRQNPKRYAAVGNKASY